MNYTEALNLLRNDLKSITKLLMGGNGAENKGLCEIVHRNTENIDKLEKMVTIQTSNLNKLVESIAQHCRVTDRAEEKMNKAIIDIKKKIESIEGLSEISIEKVGWFLNFIAMRKTNPKWFWAVVLIAALAVQVFPWWAISAAVLKKFLGIDLVLILQNIAG